jgi:hypothetical protein
LLISPQQARHAARSIIKYFEAVIRAVHPNQEFGHPALSQQADSQQAEDAPAPRVPAGSRFRVNELIEENRGKY